MTHIHFPLRISGKPVALLIGTVLALGLWVSDSQAQETTKDRDRTSGARNVVRVGYTRPGYPADRIDEKGNMRPVAWDDDYKGKLIGGTVYFMVLERKGSSGDTWATTLANFDSRFVEGKSFNNTYSPSLDTQAKYLYLYQVVNDRGLDPRPGVILPAVAREFKTEDIGVAEVKLIVDPRYITSWGYFKNTAFSAMVPDRNPSGEIRPAAEGASSNIRLACSTNPSILNELPEKRYRPRCPAFDLGALENNFGIGMGNLNLKDSFAMQQLQGKKTKGVALVNWENNVLQSADAAKEPVFAQIITGSNLEKGLSALEGEDMGNAVFRVDFRVKELLKLGHHSAIFGFTSDLPPTFEPVLIKEAEDAAKRGKGIRPVAEAPADGEGIVPAVAPGTVPTPTPPAASVGTDVAPGGLGLGNMGGQPGLGGGGAVGGGPGVGAIGGARPSGGGGGVSGFGGGQGGGEGTTSQEQKPGNNPINFNATLINQQQQKQQQQQQQHQSQNNCCHGNGNVIPAPGAFLLGLLGLPALLLVRRRNS